MSGVREPLAQKAVLRVFVFGAASHHACHAVAVVIAPTIAVVAIITDVATVAATAVAAAATASTAAVLRVLVAEPEPRLSYLTLPRAWHTPKLFCPPPRAGQSCAACRYASAWSVLKSPVMNQMS